MALTLRRRPNDQLRLHDLANLAARVGVRSVVTNDVLFHARERRILQDVVTCIRHGCTIDDAGFKRERYADRYLKPPEEMHRLFQRYPEALGRTTEIAKRCTFSLDELSYQYPEEALIPGLTAQQALAKLTLGRLPKERYPDGVPSEVVPQSSSMNLNSDRAAKLRAVFSDGEFHRAFRPQPGHSLPGERFGRQ